MSRTPHDELRAPDHERSASATTAGPVGNEQHGTTPPRPIDAQLVRELVQQQFEQWAGLRIRPVAHDGWDNRTFHLGDELSVRLPSGPGYESQVHKEATYLPVVAAGVRMPVPEVIAVGAPGAGYPFVWSVRRWIRGVPVRDAAGIDQRMLARDLAAFLLELHRLDPAAGPAAGEHSSGRGLPLSQFDDEVAEAVAELGDRVDAERVRTLWREAVEAEFDGAPVWFHGDVAVGNLLTAGACGGDDDDSDDSGAAGDNGYADGSGSGPRLSAVIDFGCAGVGDPACDLAIAWTTFDAAAREEFRAALDADDALWRRGIGWALWKALITVDSEWHGAESAHVLSALGVVDAAPVG